MYGWRLRSRFHPLSCWYIGFHLDFTPLVLGSQLPPRFHPWAIYRHSESAPNEDELVLILGERYWNLLALKTAMAHLKPARAMRSPTTDSMQVELAFLASRGPECRGKCLGSCFPYIFRLPLPCLVGSLNLGWALPDQSSASLHIRSCYPTLHFFISDLFSDESLFVSSCTNRPRLVRLRRCKNIGLARFAPRFSLQFTSLELPPMGMENLRGCLKNRLKDAQNS